MSWDNDAMSCLPESTQHSIRENFSPELLAEELSDYVNELLSMIKKAQGLASDAPEININNFDLSEIEALNKAMKEVKRELDI